jgi:malate synthase
MNHSSIPYYNDFISHALREHLLAEATPVEGIEHLSSIGKMGGLENIESFRFLCELYESLESDLNKVLNQRIKDRKFIDERTKAIASFNKEWKRDFSNADYKTVLGLEDGEGRIVIGPKRSDYQSPAGAQIAPVPDYLQGNHVTLFGPPDNAKLSVNAMNAYYRKLKDEPAIVEELLATQKDLPRWGADDEDSKTPLREDLISAGINLTKCLDGTLNFTDEATQKKYELVKENRSHPIKRFPGLALPCFFLFYKKNPIPLHLYDFALHLFQNWHNPKALVFYVPKLENEEEARYIRLMMEKAEMMIQKIHPEYQIGTIRLMIVLENPRAVFRTHEIMDELYPYFVGASLGWHDYLASTARLFKEDENYRIPVKADPDIVIKYIKASHDLLANVVGPRGGIKVGGMYGILPISNDLKGPSFQITIKGYIRDVITQLKRDLTGFWVAHPDFVRLGLALVEAWKIHLKGDSSKLHQLVKELLNEKYHEEIFNFIHGTDIIGLDKSDPMYARSLIVADIKESDFIANNHPDEIRYNVFQSLQYITDWLSGNGCVALPTQIAGVPARVMDDLATAERSRWEVWHEIYHGRFQIDQFIKIAHEEMHFIRKDKSDGKKIVQVKWDERTAKWYPVALNLMIKLMTDKEPVEFATQLFLPFTVDSIRNAEDPWEKARSLDPVKFKINEDVFKLNYFFEICGNLSFANKMKDFIAPTESEIKNIILNFNIPDILEAAYFHGDIGENKKTLDKMASSEQALVSNEEDILKEELRALGSKYLTKFGFKFLISAQGKSGQEMKEALNQRMNNSPEQEIENARNALWEITQKRYLKHPLNHFHEKIAQCFKKHGTKSAQITILDAGKTQNLSFGEATTQTWFEMASLSKSVASAFAIDYFHSKGISLDSSVDELFKNTESDFRLENKDVKICHLMSHSALNMHYVNGVPANKEMPPIRSFLTGNTEYNYPAVKVINPPGKIFQYSGGGFLALEHLIESLEKKSINELTQTYLKNLGMDDFSFQQKNLPGIHYATGFKDDGSMIEGTRKMFPSFAAGCMGTSEAMAKFLLKLEHSYHDLNSTAPLTHDTAIEMLHGTDKGCMKFMGAKMGLGIFIAEAGPNKIAIHQGANDGFRCLFIHCFKGPDRGKGLVTLCNGELKGVLFNAEIAQIILREFSIQGIDYKKFKETFSAENIPQEEVVNLGYKNLIFDAFLPDRAEEITQKGPVDPLSKFNKLIGAKILEVSNEKFARAENLISPYLPTFDPELFGLQGKIMDSWETVRHNLEGVDYLILDLQKESSFLYGMISTKYHTGNFTPEISIEGQCLKTKSWIEFLPRLKLAGHSEIKFKLPKKTETFSKIKIKVFPDGGLTRLSLFENLPDSELEAFKPLELATLDKYNEIVPQTSKPLFIPYQPSEKEIDQNWSSIPSGELFNNASAALGAKILKASDEHYSPAHLAISPFSPINMFDGMESARSRIQGSFEELHLKLARPGRIESVEIDFTYFVNNNPLEIVCEAKTKDQWVTLTNRINVKAYAGNKILIPCSGNESFEEFKIKTFPCGGFNRIKVFSRKDKN